MNIVFVYIQLNVITVLFQTIQFSISTQFSSIWPIDKTLSGAFTAAQSWPGSNVNELVLRISQNTSITGTSPSDCLVSYPGHSLGETYASAEVQSVYSTTSPTSRLGNICLHTVEWFQVFLFNTIYSIHHYSLICLILFFCLVSKVYQPS